MTKISIPEWFLRKNREKPSEKYITEKLDIPGNLWVKCYRCNETIFAKDLEKNLKVCPKCNYHFKLSAKERIDITLDKDSFVEHYENIHSTDFLNFTDKKAYSEKIEDSMLKSSLSEAVVTGEGKISDIPVAVGVMDFSFMGGSMGSVVGEKITRIAELAYDKENPLIIFSTSGGARMQEGIMSLMQMAKTSSALAKLKEKGIAYISVLTDPTTGGTSASYAMLGDVNIAEPGALIGFAGPRVIEQTIRQKLPAGFQRAEYLLSHGMVDAVCHRKELNDVLIKILRFAWDGK